ncbi:MAG: LysM peptidoglycan-binding domain-containing protein [Flavobacteriales bacterium]
MTYIRCHSVAFLLTLFVFVTQAQTNPDTIALRQAIKDNAYTSFIRHDINFVEYQNPKVVSALFDKLSQSDQRALTVLHIGDSHLQADIGAGYTRNALQEIFGFGGRGCIFPYSAAGTHSAQDYSTYHTGKWQSANDLANPPKLVLGVSGVTIRTQDSTATLTLKFNAERSKIQSHFTVLDVFCATGDSCYVLEYALDDGGWYRLQEADCVSPIQYRCSLKNAPTAQLRFRCVKSDSLQRCAVIYGISLTSANNQGIVYHSVGINGARINAVPKMTLLNTQLQSIQPDLILFDLCANDMAFGAFDSSAVRRDLDEALGIIRSACPHACIIITGLQDIYIKGRNVDNAAHYSHFLRQYAFDHDLALYDYFRVAGGRYSMKKWNKQGLCAKDMCHLSRQGYELKGQLVTNALIETYLHYLSFPSEPLIILDTLTNQVHEDKSSSVDVKEQQEKTEQPSKPKDKSANHKIHVVKAGETLYSIAKKHHTTVSKLKSLNKLKSETIRIGQKLYVS